MTPQGPTWTKEPPKLYIAYPYGKHWKSIDGETWNFLVGEIKRLNPNLELVVVKDGIEEPPR